jgi:hypothetical protein
MRWTEIVATPILETATAGASASGNVATSVGGIGAGFDPNGHKGIYDAAERKKKRKKTSEVAPAIIRR